MALVYGRPLGLRPRALRKLATRVYPINHSRLSCNRAVYIMIKKNFLHVLRYIPEHVCDNTRKKVRCIRPSVDGLYRDSTVHISSSSSSSF